METDVFSEFTKEEIIEWIRENGLFLSVSRRDLLFIRWKVQSARLQDDFQAELGRWNAGKPDFVRRDELASEANRTDDIHQKLRILKQIAPYDRALSDHLGRMKKLDERQRRVDLLYHKINEAQS